MWLGPQLSLLQVPKERRGRPTATETLTKARRSNTLSLTKMRQQWEAEMERLNSKYNLDCFFRLLSLMKVNNADMNTGMKH